MRAAGVRGAQTYPSLRGAQATKQFTLSLGARWIASQSLSSDAHSRDPLDRNDARVEVAIG
jgi:hypothetical protein